MSSVARSALTVIVLGAGLLGAIAPAPAEPAFAVRTGYRCSQCHVNRSGGGMRTAFGSLYTQTILPARLLEWRREQPASRRSGRPLCDRSRSALAISRHPLGRHAARRFVRDSRGQSLHRFSRGSGSPVALPRRDRGPRRRIDARAVRPGLVPAAERLRQARQVSPALRLAVARRCGLHPPVHRFHVQWRRTRAWRSESSPGAGRRTWRWSTARRVAATTTRREEDRRERGPTLAIRTSRDLRGERHRRDDPRHRRACSAGSASDVWRCWPRETGSSAVTTTELAEPSSRLSRPTCRSREGSTSSWPTTGSIPIETSTPTSRPATRWAWRSFPTRSFQMRWFVRVKDGPPQIVGANDRQIDFEVHLFF